MNPQEFNEFNLLVAFIYFSSEEKKSRRKDKNAKESIEAK